MNPYKMLGKYAILRENISMTEEQAILARIDQLPERLKREVFDFVEFLQKKHKGEFQKSIGRKPGSAKGKYKLASDFDSPLEDFKEYS